MASVRYPDRSQFARPMQFRQHLGVTPVGLHPVAGFHRNERGSDDHTLVPEAGELPMNAIAARTVERFSRSTIAKVQQTPVGTQPPGKLADMIGAVGNGAPVAHFAAASSTRNGHRDRRFVDIQPDKQAILHLVSPPFLRLGASPSGAILEGECSGRGHRPNHL